MEIYRLTKRFTAEYLDKFKDMRLIGHMNDSARSIPSNIREGAKRRDTKAYLEFLGFSRGSLEELKGDYEELKRELVEKERWKDKDREGLIRIKKDIKDKDREGLIRIKKDIEGLLDLVYGEDCMLGRQIRSIENKMIKEKTLSENEMIRRSWRSEKSRNENFWRLAKEKFGIERDKEGRIRIKKEKKDEEG